MYVCAAVRSEIGGFDSIQCEPCIKTSGTPTSNNFIYPDDHFKITKGNLKTWSRKGESGKVSEPNISISTADRSDSARP